MRQPRRFAGAAVIAAMMSAALLATPKPVAAEEVSLCAILEAAKINIEASHAPGFAKDLALGAISAAQVAAGCVAE